MFTVLLALFFQLATSVPQPTHANLSESCTLQGVVVKAGTGEPLHKAIVQALPERARNRGNDKSTGGLAEGGITETDAAGRFELKGLAPGEYRLMVDRNGFVNQQYGQRTPDSPGQVLSLFPGQKIPDITFRMIPAAVISGHVLDEDGEPVLWAQVAAMSYAYQNGQCQLVNSGVPGMTNDLGEFRIFGLSPGQYIV